MVHACLFVGFTLAPPSSASRTELKAAFTPILTEKQALKTRAPEYFDAYTNLATYKGSVPPNALPQTGGSFALTAPLRPNPAHALAQLRASGASEDAAPADTVYRRTTAKLHATQTMRLSASAAAMSTRIPSESLMRATVRQGALGGDRDVAPRSTDKLKGDAAYEVLRGGHRTLSMVTGATAGGWSQLRSDDIAKLLAPGEARK